MAVCFLGVASAATCAPLNPSYRESEFTFYFDDLQPKLVILKKGLESPARQAAASRAIPILELSFEDTAPAGVFELGSGSTNTIDLAEPDDIALVLHTSGTTSRPKIVPLRHKNLCASARHIGVSLALTPDDRCLNVMPLFHIHGLVAAVLSSLAAGASLVCTEGFVAPRFFAWLDEFAPTWYTAVPTMHQAILARAEQNRDIIARHPLRFLRSSSSPLPPTVMQGLQGILGAPVIEAYGMTEASHQMASNPLPPRVRKPGSVGLPAGVEIAILDEGGNLVRGGPDGTAVGEIVIRGPSVTAGYSNNPEANREAFRDGWFRTGDLGRMDADGYLFLCGRTKEMINRGGEKISPREVDEVLLEHPAVGQALAFAMPDATLGEDVAAAVVLKENATVTELELREFVAGRLADFKIPSLIVFVNEIPKGPTGKPQRLGMAARLGLKESAKATAKPRMSFTPPRTQTEVCLAELWSQILQVETISVHDDFFNSGGDSILATQFCSRIKSALGAELSFPRLFEIRTLAGIAAWLDSSGAAHASQRLPSILSAARRSELPLSYAQRQIWFLDRFDDGSANYIRPAAFRLRGPLDVDVLHISLNEIVSRHEILRTVYQERDGLPVQIVRAAGTLALPLSDFSLIPEHERLSRSRELSREEAWRPFDLSTDLMMRARLLRLGQEEHILLLTMHHIATDGWSSRLILRELAEIYRAKCEERNAILPVLTIQYADFALFEQQCFEDGLFDGQIEYWKGRLAGCPELLRLPTDRPRPDRQTYRGGVEDMVVPKELVASLKNLGLQNKATLYMMLLAAFQVLLYRYTGEEDLVVGSPIAGRTNAGTEPLIGLFSNVLPMRADLSGDPSFREFLARTRGAALAAYVHQDVPIEKLIECLPLNRSVRHPALFQVMFQLRNLPAEVANLGSVALEPFDFDAGTAQFDLSLEVRQRAEGLCCALNYNSDIYQGGTARRMLDHYRTLLEAIVANVDQSISELNILPEQERRQVLVHWNETAAEYPQDSLIHELISALARNAPDRVAVVFQDEQITYGGLDWRANGWAHRFRELGVTRGVLVGISMERSVSQLVAILGILKAGGAYVPLDPAYPRQRLADMVEDTRCALLVTTSEHAQNLPPGGTRVLCIDQEDTHGITSNANPPISDVQPHDCAYVIFTSGSTGRPNGVMIEHRSLVNNSSFFAKHFGLQADDRILQFNSLSFDTAAEEIFPCCLAGATLVLWPEPKAPSIADFLQFVEREGITLLDLPTAYWHEWVSEISFSDLRFPASLRAVIIGGEKALAPKLAEWKKAAPGRIRLCNTYGPTEATITSMAYDTDQGNGTEDPVPIGRPISNATLYILDRFRQPVPVGVPGELYIGGAGIARGYLNRPELTAQRFISNPFRSVPDPCLYKTGDLARYLPNGTIEFLGRTDEQVKWRGFRIELGEVENTLARHPHVRAVAASLREETVDHPGLVAYVVPDQDAPPTRDHLHRFLQERLPHYMLPSQYVFLEELPFSPSGKVDRRALPQPDWLPSTLQASFAPPRTDLEQQIASIWMDVLGIDSIGIYDNFFDLGGHSLKVVQMLSRLRRTLHVEVPLRRVFERPTIADTAVAVLQIFAERLDPSEIAEILAGIEGASGNAAGERP